MKRRPVDARSRPETLINPSHNVVLQPVHAWIGPSQLFSVSIARGWLWWRSSGPCRLPRRPGITAILRKMLPSEPEWPNPMGTYLQLAIWLTPCIELGRSVAGASENGMQWPRDGKPSVCQSKMYRSRLDPIKDRFSLAIAHGMLYARLGQSMVSAIRFSNTADVRYSAGKSRSKSTVSSLSGPTVKCTKSR